MKWIEPGGPKRKIVKCEFCGADVSGPYKGIHEETEIINGIPTGCRNNGRMNADIAFPHLANIAEKARDGIKWFIEHTETHEWWTGYAWTNDPLQAFGCDKKRTAQRYALFQRAKNPGIGENWMITEHEFVKPSHQQ